MKTTQEKRALESLVGRARLSEQSGPVGAQSRVGRETACPPDKDPPFRYRLVRGKWKEVECKKRKGTRAANAKLTDRLGETL